MSLRFLGRKVYTAVIVLQVPALRCLRALVGASRRTITRWHRWWCETFVSTQFWQSARASFYTTVSTVALPASLLERFIGDPASQLLGVLRFLGPLTGGAEVLACDESVSNRVLPRHCGAAIITSLVAFYGAADAPDCRLMKINASSAYG